MFHGYGDRFFHQDVFAGIKRVHTAGKMELMGQAQDRRFKLIDLKSFLPVRIDLDQPEFRGQIARAFFILIDDRYRLGTRHFFHGRQMYTSNVTATNNSKAHNSSPYQKGLGI